eukprot:Em0144g9a
MSGEEGSAATSEQTAEGQQQQPEANDDGPCTVLVTGASGYIATHLIQQLLKQGRFRVRGTIRNLSYSKIEPLKKLVPDAKYPLELVQADLKEAVDWVAAVKGCSYVFHVASPFPAKIPRDENTLIQPAVDGTLNVLRACSDAGCVKRVVLTSSIAAVSSGMNGNGKSQQVYSEQDWSVEQNCSPYEKGKLRAELAAWTFVRSLEESRRFELAVVNPGVVIGPLLTTTGGDASIQSILQLFIKPVGVPNVNWPLVDVRDVAAAHIAAMEKKEAAGNRCVLVVKNISYTKMADIVFREFFPLGYRTCTMPLPDFAMWLAKWFDDGVKWLYPALGKHNQYNTDMMRNVLGITPRSVNETIIDTCYSLIELGMVKKTPQYIERQSRQPPSEEPKEKGETEGTPAQESKEEEPKEEEPKEEEPKEEEPKEEEPKEENPRRRNPRRRNPGGGTKEEEPKEEEPKKKEPKEEEEELKEKPKKELKEEPKKKEPKKEPKKEEPKKEPKKEKPKKVEPKKAEPKKVEPKKEEPKNEPKKEPKKEPKEEPKKEEPKEEPKKEEPKKESKKEPKEEELKEEEPKKKEPKEEPKKEPKEEPRKEEPRKEEPRKEEPRKEEPRKEEPRKEEPRKEEPRKEEPKKEEPKKEEAKEERGTQEGGAQKGGAQKGVQEGGTQEGGTQEGGAQEDGAQDRGNIN